MQPPPIPTQRRGPSRTAIGCAVVASLVLLALLCFIVWIVIRPRPSLSVATVAGPDAVLVLHLRDLSNDPGAIELGRKVDAIQIEALREQLEQDLPSGMQGFGRIMLGMQQANRTSHYMLPETILALEPGRGTNAVEVLVAARVGGFMRLLIGFMTGTMGRVSGGPVRYGGRKYVDFAGEAFLSTSRGIVLFSTYREGMERMIDRLRDAPPPAPLMNRLPLEETEAWDFVVLADHPGDLLELGREALLDFVEVEEAEQEFPGFDGVVWGWLGLDIHTGDWIRGRMRLFLADADSAALTAREWQGWLEERLAPLRDGGLQAMLTVRQEGAAVQVDLDLTDIGNALREGLRRLMDDSAPPSVGAAPAGEAELQND